MINRLALGLCALVALGLAIAFEYIAIDLWLHARDATPALVPCALGVLMIWLTFDIAWGARCAASVEESALAQGGEAPAPADD